MSTSSQSSLELFSYVKNFLRTIHRARCYERETEKTHFRLLSEARCSCAMYCMPNSLSALLRASGQHPGLHSNSPHWLSDTQFIKINKHPGYRLSDSEAPFSRYAIIGLATLRLLTWT